MPMTRMTVAAADGWKLVASGVASIAVTNLTTNRVSIMAVTAGAGAPAATLAATDAGTPILDGPRREYSRSGLTAHDFYARMIDSSSTVLNVET